MIGTWTCGGKVYNMSDTYCAFIRDQNNKLVANLTLTEDHDESLGIATLMAKAPDLREALLHARDVLVSLETEAAKIVLHRIKTVLDPKS